MSQTRPFSPAVQAAPGIPTTHRRRRWIIPLVAVGLVAIAAAVVLVLKSPLAATIATTAFFTIW